MNKNNKSEIICPYCDYVFLDSWEYDNDSELIKCPTCNKKFNLQICTSITYSTKKRLCKDKGEECEYELDKIGTRGFYIYRELNWTTWLCSKCGDRKILTGEIAKDEKPYIIPWEGE